MQNTVVSTVQSGVGEVTRHPSHPVWGLPFHRSQAPFDDVCVHLSAPDASGSPGSLRIAAAIRLAMGETGFRYDSTFGQRGRVSVYSLRTAVTRDPDGFSFFDGYASRGEHALLPGAEIAQLLRRLGRRAASEPILRGNFTGVVGDRDRVFVFTDWLGLSQLYWTSVGQHRLVSNRLHLLARILLVLGNLELRPTGLAQSIVFDTTFGHETLFEGVKLLPFGSYFEADGARVRECVRFDALTQQGRAPGDYGELIHQAAIEIRENWVAAQEFCRDRPLVLYLTGGIDSRIALAGAVSAGILPLWYYTYGAAGGADRRIAATLGAATGVPRIDEGIVADPSVSAAVEYWLSLHFGERNFSLQPLARSRSESIRLGGAAGEVMRGFYSTLAEHKLGTVPCPASAEEHAKWLTRTLGRWKLVHRKVRAAVEAELARAIAAEPLVMETSASLDGLYSLFRNRFHFGLSSRVSSSLTSLMLVPLYSPSALVASLGCSYDARRRGKVAYDLTRVLAPSLLEIEYERGFFPSDVVSAPPTFEPRPLTLPPRIPSGSSLPSAPGASRRDAASYDRGLLDEFKATEERVKAWPPDYSPITSPALLLAAIAKARNAGDRKQARALIMQVRMLEVFQ